jgi:adenosine kinase
MHFPGKFSEQLLADQIHKVSLSFLVDELEIRRGGVAPNICYGMAQLGSHPVLIGAVGEDFDEYRGWLDRHGVDTRFVHVSQALHTARFVCTTDDDLCQIGSFYTGAMAESRMIELQRSWEATGSNLAVISAYDPDAMVQHTQECRDRGYRFAADPSQQIARMSGEQLAQLIEGADILFTNEYEKSLLEAKTGFSEADIRAQVNVQVTTLGSNGAGRQGTRQGRPDRCRGRLPRRSARGTGVGAVVGALGTDRQPARDDGPRDRRNAGVRDHSRRLQQASRRVLR